MIRLWGMQFFDFWRVGILPWVVVSHPMPLCIGYFLHGFVDVSSHRGL